MSEERVVPIRKGCALENVSGVGLKLQTEAAAFANSYASPNPDGSVTPMAAFVIIGVDSVGRFQVGWTIDEAVHSLLGRTMLAGLAQAAIQRDMIADAAACEVIVRNGLRQPEPEPEA